MHKSLKALEHASGKFGWTEDAWSSSNPPLWKGSKFSSVFLGFKSCQTPALMYFLGVVSRVGDLLNLEQGQSDD